MYAYYIQQNCYEKLGLTETRGVGRITHRDITKAHWFQKIVLGLG